MKTTLITQEVHLESINKNFSHGQRVCLICNKVRLFDEKPSWQGGLGRCSEVRAAARIVKRKVHFIEDDSHRFFTAANRLQMILGCESHDIFVVDLYYPKLCYIKFAINPKDGETATERPSDDLAISVLNEFYRIIEKEILKKRKTHLLSDILEDLKNLIYEYGIDPVLVHTVGLLRNLIQHFSEERLGFHPQGRYVIVYSQDTNPCEYSVAIIKGHGLRDGDLVRSIARMIWRKIKRRSTEEQTWPYTPDELVDNHDQ